MSDATCDAPSYDGAWRGINQRYLTPSDTPTTYTCRRIRIPDQPEFRYALAELISRLSFCDTWDERPGGLTSIEAAALGSALFDSFVESEDYCMIGAIVPVMRATLPANMLWCDGSTYLRTDYPDLYAVSDAVFIVDADHFVVPDLRHRTVIGSDTDYPVNASGGEATHTLTTGEMPSHTHTQDSHNHTQDSHNHSQSSHNHTQDSHNHTQNSHGHTGNSHGHSISDPGHFHSIAHDHTITQRNSSAAGTAASAMSSNGLGTTQNQTTSGSSAANSGSKVTGISVDNSVISVQDATATNNAATATNQATTATNNAATATNQATNATNQNTGGGGSHNNMQPYRVLPMAVIAK